MKAVKTFNKFNFFLSFGFSSIFFISVFSIIYNLLDSLCRPLVKFFCFLSLSNVISVTLIFAFCHFSLFFFLLFLLYPFLNSCKHRSLSLIHSLSQSLTCSNSLTPSPSWTPSLSCTPSLSHLLTLPHSLAFLHILIRFTFLHILIRFAFSHSLTLFAFSHSLTLFAFSHSLTLFALSHSLTLFAFSHSLTLFALSDPPHSVKPKRTPSLCSPSRLPSLCSPSKDPSLCSAFCRLPHSVRPPDSSLCSPSRTPSLCSPSRTLNYNFLNSIINKTCNDSQKLQRCTRILKCYCHAIKLSISSYLSF
ncbi:unnamed protein product [Acanthosepion pharaonis]|uniref:Uncharacterized protein n=1 Tax=Acanthosepion pharaonis TaxID=158019 RepID=A0A812BBR2_ACAPH|nr:unnamed protein product [Sepia pharaonis]